jgi:hypothetical protein
VGFFTPASQAQAVTGANFDPANIISDSFMFNGSAMSAVEVQVVLNAMGTYRLGVVPPSVPRCTMGDAGKPAGGIYTFPSGFQTVLANNCLKDYSAAIPSLAADSICTALPGGTISAAEMIYRIGVACNVSQKVLLVLLEKEQSLISDTFPAQVQYNSAVGFNCPDTAPCSAASAGFFKQVYAAARQLQVYGTGSFTWYPVGQVTPVLFHPNHLCGASSVLIANRATAALYYYTPYQPNGAALSNPYGTGDACSAYGNRNFWRMYSDWFGSTQEIVGSPEFVTAAYADVLGREPDSASEIYWIGRIASGMSRTDMANAFNNSDEYRINKIREAYHNALRREPDPGGAAYWLGALQRGELSPENVYSTFLYMNEMYDVQGGGTNPGYITSMYRELLNRDPDPVGLNYWTTRLNNGESRSAVSNSIWYSPEKYNVRVTDAFSELLGRTASPADQAYWSSVAMQSGPTAMRSLIMSSDEYWNRASARF